MPVLKTMRTRAAAASELDEGHRQEPDDCGLLPAVDHSRRDDGHDRERGRAGADLDALDRKRERLGRGRGGEQAGDADEGARPGGSRISDVTAATIPIAPRIDDGNEDGKRARRVLSELELETSGSAGGCAIASTRLYRGRLLAIPSELNLRLVFRRPLPGI